MSSRTIQVRDLGLCDYAPVFQNMLDYTDTRNSDSQDQIWFLEHQPVYTLGKNAKKHHVLNPGEIPLVQVDRGGQVTYHGPGQLIAYLLLDVRRAGLGVRQVVSAMEQALINLLSDYSVPAFSKPDAPGVYVPNKIGNKDEKNNNDKTEKKIAALGLRIRKGCSYHGLSFNLDMDTSPFNGINPCGYEGLEIAQLSDYVSEIDKKQIQNKLLNYLMIELGYKGHSQSLS